MFSARYIKIIKIFTSKKKVNYTILLKYKLKFHYINSAFVLLGMLYNKNYVNHACRDMIGTIDACSRQVSHSI